MTELFWLTNGFSLGFKAQAEITKTGAYLDFVGVSGNTKGFVCSCRHGAVLDHHHLHSGSLLMNRSERVRCVAGPPT